MILSTKKAVTEISPSCPGMWQLNASTGAQRGLNSDSSTVWEDLNLTSKENHSTGYPGMKEMLSNSFYSIRKKKPAFPGSLGWAGGIRAQSKHHRLHKGLPKEQSPHCINIFQFCILSVLYYQPLKRLTNCTDVFRCALTHFSFSGLSLINLSPQFASTHSISVVSFSLFIFFFTYV